MISVYFAVFQGSYGIIFVVRARTHGGLPRLGLAWLARLGLD